MSQNSDLSRNPDYHAARADEERQIAESSADPNTRAIHADMAERHAALAEEKEPKPQ